MIGLFSDYNRQRLLPQMLFDYGVVVLIVVGIVILQVEAPRQVMPQAATHGVSLATWLFFVNSASGIYQPTPQQSWPRVIARALLATLLALPLAYALFALLPPGSGNEGMMSFAAMVGVAAVTIHRVYATHAASASARHKILIVGAGARAQIVAQTLKASDPLADIVGHYPSPNEPVTVDAADLLATQGSLAGAASQLGVKEIVVAVSERRGGSMPMRDLLECKVNGIRVSDLNTYFEKALGQIRLDFVNAGWLIFGDGFRQGLFRTTVKRLFDIVASIVLLVTLAPVMIVTAALIKLDSRGPLFYRQERVGFNGQTFHVIKFRSMRADAERDGPRWACADDDRITKVGRVIRKLRIDELPQLINVLAGQMSIVGPRPERPCFVDQLTADIPYYAVRHSIKPGVTGWAQVRYHYGATVEDSQEKLQYDLYYVKNHSLWLDCLILLETVGVVLTGKGAR